MTHCKVKNLVIYVFKFSKTFTFFHNTKRHYSAVSSESGTHEL